MSTNYSGDRTATQAPASPPDSVTPALVVLPADGDPLTAASVAQALKELADQQAFERLPFGNGGIASGRPIKSYADARGLTRFHIDHQGFPAGKILQWNEAWDDVAMVMKTAVNSGVWGGRWNYAISGPGGSAGAIQAIDASTAPRTPAARLRPCTAGTSGGSISMAHIETGLFPILVDADTDVSIQWDFSPETITANVPEFAMGLSTVRQGSTTLWSAGAQPGAALVYRSTAAGSSTNDTNIQCYTCAVGGAPAYVSTGLAPGAAPTFRARMDICGANASDDSTARVLFRLMGALKANVAVDLSNGTSPVVLMPFFRLGAVDVQQNLRIGLVDLRSASWPGNITF